jgi:elongation factor Ts
MTKITASDVNKLRQITGIGIMDCKKALVESDGNFEKAIIYLRKKGKKLSEKRAGKEAKQGIVISKASQDNKKVVSIMLNCETDFVAMNQEFKNLANTILDKALSEMPKSIEQLKSLTVNGKTIADIILDNMGKTGEKIELSNYEYIESPKVFAYNHQGNRLSAIVGLNKNNIDNIDIIAKEISMQIAAMSPVAIDKNDVNPKIVENEIEIGKEQARREGKPEKMIGKIAIGKLNKFYQENTLLNQKYIRDNKKTIRQYLAENDKDLTVTDFKRLMLKE